MSRENVEVVRKPLRVGERSSRAFDQRFAYASLGWQRRSLAG